MTNLDKVKKFLSETKDISLGYNEINFVDTDNLDEAQIGYSVDTNSNSLISDNDGDWKKEWIVIASDQLGDPIIVDTNTSELTILSASNGEGDWETFTIADTLDTFKNIISLLRDISKDRTNPKEIEKNPISENDKQNILTKIESKNPDTEIWFWENFLEND